MFIKEYRYGYYDGEEAVYAEIYMDNAPSQLPTNTDNLSPLKPGLKFRTGSLIYIVSTGDLYMAMSDGTWVAQ